MASSSTAPADTPLRLSLSTEEEAKLRHEVTRLQATSVVCKLVGSRPSRGGLRDLLQGYLLADAGKIIDIQPLGRNYYQVEFETAEMAAHVLTRSPLSLPSARAHFCAWHHAIDIAADPLAAAAGFPVSVCFPGLRKEYRALLPALGRSFGIVLEEPQTAASVVAKAAGLPSIRVLVPDPDALPTEIQLPTLAGSWIPQRVEYSGLPNQCFVCRQIGHLARNCPRPRPRPKAGGSSDPPPRLHLLQEHRLQRL